MSENTPFEQATIDALPDATHAEVFEASPRVVCLRLDAGERVPPHTHPDRTVLFHLLDGELELTVGDETTSLRPGTLVRFPGDREVSPHAVADSVALVVFAPPADD